jgi:hypothetical protein
MKQSILILIGLLFCQCTSNKTSEVKDPDKNAVTKEKSKESNTLMTDESLIKMTGKDAVKALKKTNEFQFDFKNNNLGFKLKIVDFTDESNEFYYLSTVRKVENGSEQIISNYRVSSVSGKIQKKSSSGEWQGII